MKKFLLFLSVALFGLVGTANATLWNYYQERGLALPSVQSRSADALVCGIEGYQGTALENQMFEKCLRGQLGDKLGSATAPVAGVTYNLAGSGITASATSIVLTSLTIPQTGYELVDADFSTTFYITLEPGNIKRQEIVSCTTVSQNGSNTQATLSGCIRGLSPFTPYGTSSSLKFAHGGGTTVIFSDPPQLFAEYASKLNNETVTGTWTFNTDPIASSTTHITGDPSAYVTLYAMNQATSTGGSNASTVVKGVVQEATDSMLQSSSSTGSTGARTYANGGSFAQTSTANKVPVSNGSGKLDPNYINTSTDYFWGTQTFTTTTESTTTVTGRLTVPTPVNATDAASLNYVTSSILTATSTLNFNKLIMSTTTNFTTSSAAQNIEFIIVPTTTITGGLLNTNNILHVHANIKSVSIASTRTLSLRVKYGGVTTISQTYTAPAANISVVGSLDFYLTGSGATNSQENELILKAFIDGVGDSTVPNTSQWISRLSTGSSSVDTTQSSNFAITASWDVAGGSESIDVDSSYIEIIR